MQYLIEKHELRDLIDRSSDAINHQEWAALMTMMTEDVVWERLPPTPWTLDGRTAVSAFLVGNAAELDILHYAISATAIDVLDPTHAAARSTMSELIALRKTGAALHVVGTYSDLFVKRDGVWYFGRRTITPRYEEDVELPPRIFIPTTSSSASPAAPR